MRFFLTILMFCAGLQTAAAQEVEPPMTMNRMGEILLALDPDAQVSPTAIEMSLDGIPVIVIADPRADRMRAMVPI